MKNYITTEIHEKFSNFLLNFETNKPKKIVIDDLEAVLLPIEKYKKIKDLFAYLKKSSERQSIKKTFYDTIIDNPYKGDDEVLFKRDKGFIFL
ncbi:MAG: hypothetical protein ACTSXL_04355 [Alphaproteobacteria bacterium]